MPATYLRNRARSLAAWGLEVAVRSSTPSYEHRAIFDKLVQRVRQRQAMLSKTEQPLGRPLFSLRLRHPSSGTLLPPLQLLLQRVASQISPLRQVPLSHCAEVRLVHA